MSYYDIIEECLQALDTAMPEYNRMESYYLGTQPLAYLPDEVRRAVGNRLQPVHINWPRIVCSSVEERLDVERFRRADSSNFDEAWEIWVANHLDEESQLAHLDALLYGRSYVSVWSAPERTKPLIAVESPKEVWVETDPVTRKPIYGVKRWFDKHADRGFLNVYTAEEVTKWQTKQVRDEFIDVSNLPANAWELRRDIPSSLPNPLGEVPLIPLVNRRRIVAPVGESELTDCLPLADAINKLATDMMISAEFHAMPRRFATGVEVIEDEAGEVQETFSILKGRTWIAEDPNAHIGSLPEADLTGFINAIEMLSVQLASIGHIPPHYMNAAKGSLASADSIRASEASLVSLVRRKMLSFGSSWEEVMKLALRVSHGSLSLEQEKLEVQWKDPENRTEAQLVDAATKRAGVGVPYEQLWEDMGYTEGQIARMKQMRKDEASAPPQLYPSTAAAKTGAPVRDPGGVARV